MRNGRYIILPTSSCNKIENLHLPYSSIILLALIGLAYVCSTRNFGRVGTKTKDIRNTETGYCDVVSARLVALQTELKSSVFPLILPRVY